MYRRCLRQSTGGATVAAAAIRRTREGYGPVLWSAVDRRRRWNSAAVFSSFSSSPQFPSNPFPSKTQQSLHSSRFSSSSSSSSSSSPLPPPTQPISTKNHHHHNKKKLVRSLRSNAARSIPFWLGNDQECFQRTLHELNLTSAKPNAQTGILLEYKHIYQNSLPSFFEQHILVQANRDNTEEITNNRREDGEQKTTTRDLLDKLVEVGFGDLKWAKNHRKMKQFQLQLQNMKKAIKRKERTYQEQLKTVQGLEEARIKLLEEARTGTNEHNSSNNGSANSYSYGLIEEEEEDDDDDEEQETPGAMTNQTKEGSNLFQKFLGAFQTWFRSDKPDDLLPPSAPTSKVVAEEDAPFHRRMRRKLRRHDRRREAARATAETTRLQLEGLRQQQDSFQPLMSEQQFEEANEVVQQVLEHLCPEFAKHIQRRHQDMIKQYQTLDSKTDLTKPHEWYPRARLDRRKIVFHGGPTNSGKTYQALQRLKEANHGLYLGPLRLLAAEVYETLTSEGIYTNLYTGQEKRQIPFATHSAATVEMAPLDRDFDVVVIDEVQMIADPSRGFAWTRALMGLRCKEIHVCGGMEARPLVEKIAQACGDELELHQYERFSRLQVAEESLSKDPHAHGSYAHIQPGDCVVAFSRQDIFAIKREIETLTDYKCSVIYGSLPPETRTEQARRFNNPDSGYDILVASDAIGMGLNLNIRRIIFNSMLKSDGEKIILLGHSSVKQIAGRAGRRNSPYPHGEVTCRDPRDMKHLRRCMSQEIATIEKAGLLPTSAHIQSFSEALQRYGLSKDYENLGMILGQFSDMATLKGNFFLCRQTPMRRIAKLLVDLNFPMTEKYTLCMAPALTDNLNSMTTLRKFAVKLARGKSSGLGRYMIPRQAKSFEDLSNLCATHADLELFLWLSHRFPGNLVEQQAATALKEDVIRYVNKGLNETENLKLDHCYISRDGRLRDQHKKWKKKNAEEALFQGGEKEEDEDDEDEDSVELPQTTAA